jgi:hypothetical protein
VVGDADVVAGGDHRVAGLEARVAAVDHRARQVDAAHAGKAPDDLAGAGGGQRVLVIDARIGHLDEHLTRVEPVDAERLHGGGHLAVLVLADDVGLEGGTLVDMFSPLDRAPGWRLVFLIGRL